MNKTKKRKVKVRKKRSYIFEQSGIRLKVSRFRGGFHIAARLMGKGEVIEIGTVWESQTGNGLQFGNSYLMPTGMKLGRF